MDELPSSISNLVYLYSLDFYFSWNVRVPNVLKKMMRLKHLVLPSYSWEGIEKCRVTLDEGLDELETLVGFHSLVHELKSITRMKNLRRLTAVVCDNESLSALINVITTKWKDLQYCEVSIEHGCQLTYLDEGLMKLKILFICPIVHGLMIHVQLGKLLEQCSHQIITSKLVSLELFECEIEDDPMEILGLLPFLEDLNLWPRSFLRENMRCRASSFPRLKYLILSGLPNLREWRVEQGVMPLLSIIEMRNCSQLQMIPDGLRFIATLQKLMMRGMAQLEKRVSSEERISTLSDMYLSSLSTTSLSSAIERGRNK